MQNQPTSPAAALPHAQPGVERTRYQALRAQLAFAPSALPTLAILALDGLLLLAWLYLVRRGDVPSFLLSQLLLAVVFFHGFALVHECGHGSAFRQNWLNVLVGHVASVFCLIPYYPWKYIHQKHHTWAGNIERDPVLKSLRTWRAHGVPRLVRLAWWSWIPLGAALQHVVYLSYPLVMWRAGEMNAPKAVRSLISILWLVVAHALSIAFVPEVTWSNVALAVVVYLVVEELVNLPHHVDMSTFEQKLPLWEQHLATRSCYYPPVVSELLVLNFNFHIEHHWFPTLPWYRLRKARALVRPALGEAYEEAVGIAWNLKNRTRDLQTIVDAYAEREQLDVAQSPSTAS